MMKSKQEVMKDLGRVFKHRITIQKLTSTTDELFNQVTEWVDFGDPIKAEVNGLFGNEYYNAKNTNEENTLNISVRYFQGLDNLNTTEYRISFNGKIYDIKHVDHVKFEKKYVIIKALERGLNGL